MSRSRSGGPIQARRAAQTSKTPPDRLARAAPRCDARVASSGVCACSRADCIESLRDSRLGALAVAAIVAATLLVPMARPSAHEGHDHGPPQAATGGAAAPRIAVHSESYELVGILKGDQLVIYLDRFASNEPVTAATVAVTIGDAADAVNAAAETGRNLCPDLAASAHGGTGGTDLRHHRRERRRPADRDAAGAASGGRCAGSGKFDIRSHGGHGSRTRCRRRSE